MRNGKKCWCHVESSLWVCAVFGSKWLDNLVRESVCASAGIDVSMRDWTGSLCPCLLSLRLHTNKHTI